MGFAAGFNAGFNAVSSGIQHKEDKERLAQIDSREDEKWKLEKDKLEQEKKDRDAKNEANAAITNFLQQDYIVPDPAPATPMSRGTGVNQSAGNANASPMAFGTNVGGPSAKTQLPKYKMPDINTASQRVLEAQMLASQYPEHSERLSAYATTLKNTSLAEYARQFNGDPMANPVGYMRHMAKGSALFGQNQTPEQVKAQAQYLKQMQNEGFEDALKNIKLGDVEAANKSWNSSGKMRGTITNVKDAPMTIYGQAVPNKVFEVVSEDGSVQRFNTAQLEMTQMSLNEMITTGQNQQKTDADLANTDSLIRDRDADNKRADAETVSVIEDRKADNKRADADSENLRRSRNEQTAQGWMSTVQGADDVYVVNKNPAMQGATALNVGVKKTATDTKNTDAHGRTISEIRGLKSDVKTIIDDAQYGAGRTMMSEVQKMDPKAYDQIINVAYSLVDQNVSVQDAASAATALSARILKLKEDGSENPVDQAMKEFELLQKNNTGDTKKDFRTMFGLDDPASK